MFSTHLPISEACERNKDPILAVLKNAFADVDSVLEIGSGTGQHAMYFAHNLPHLTWQASDFDRYLPNLKALIESVDIANLANPIEVDVRSGSLSIGSFDAVFSANTLHIMGASAVEDFFRLVGRVLKSGGVLAVYGPFNYQGAYSSESNERFDMHLRAQNIDSAIRDFEWVCELAVAQGLSLVKDIDMPANNQCLIWRKS